ncbi:hypothetical protein JCM10908_007019 [Rhodotorula pacifica]|uniref:uncharacterized protein n=1 Tax=Rhodotorula pacifica TaxID=1495444 RepID=UPI00317BB0AE
MLRYSRRWRAGRSVLFFICGGTLLWWTLRWSTNLAPPDVKICLVGNAESQELAERVYRQWGRAFPASFYVWGRDRPRANLSIDHDRLLLVVPDPGQDALPFTDGLMAAVDEVTSRHTCDYIFTHDDDLSFSLEEHAVHYDARDKTANLAQELVYILSKYNPAIAGFPWQVGDDRFEAMRELKELYELEEVAPLTGFDNGMVLYHRSVLPLFFPFAPHGEGGFTGKWTLGAHFLQLFGPSIFAEHALRLNSFAYENTVNMDNVAKNDDDVTRVEDGLAYVPASRHPYEYPLNEAYQSFLASGLHDRSQRWGRDLEIEDVVEPAIWPRGDYPWKWIVDRLAQFYDPRHEALSRTRLIQHLPTEALSAYTADSSATPSFRVILFTKNRLRSFARCWKSVRTAFPIQAPVYLEVRVDLDESMSMRDEDEYLDYLDAMQDDLGPGISLDVIHAKSPLGLRESIVSSWDPVSNNEFAIFLEDDIEVSPYFLRYAEHMVEAYVYRDRADHRLTAISLYNLRYNEAVEDFVTIDNKHTPYIYQQPQSWGAIYLPEPWRQFKLWMKNFPWDKDPVVPDSLTNRWPYQRSWKKFYIRFLLERGGYLIYPNLPDQLSYSTNHVEVGTNDKPADPQARAAIHAKFRVPLLSRDDEMSRMQVYPKLSALQVYSLQHEKKASIDDLVAGSKQVSTFDRCTLIMPVLSRTGTISQRLDYYHTFDRIGQILVLWNKLDLDPPLRSYDNYSIPVELLKMERDSLNNRFVPWPQIKFDCIINMDDDWEMPFEHLRYGIDVWRGHFWNNLIGFSHQGRNHVVREVDGEEKTLYSATFLSPERLAGKKAFYSIVLTSGFICHRKYLDMYTNELPKEALAFVDQHMNGEDLLFNYMVANATGMGPIVIEAWAAPIATQNNAGLWSRPGHMAARTEALRLFDRLFRRNPLRYTTSLFPIQHSTTVPGLHHYTMSETIPFAYPCNRTVYDLQEQCAMIIDEEFWGFEGTWIR